LPRDERDDDDEVVDPELSIGIVRRRDDDGDFGISTLRTPFVIVACAFSTSASPMFTTRRNSPPTHSRQM
jgi:hypothetical protein